MRNKTCSGDPVSIAGGPSDTGRTSERVAAVPSVDVPGTNQSGPPSDSSANRNESPVQSLTNQEVTPVNSKSTERAGPAGQRPQLEPVSKYNRGSTGVLRPRQPQCQK